MLMDRINHRWQVRVFARPVKVYANASHKMSAILAARCAAMREGCRAAVGNLFLCCR